VHQRAATQNRNEYVQIGQTEGAKLLTGGHRLTDGPFAKGWFHEPTVFGDCNPKMRVAQEEIFGLWFQ